ncbi:MAG TPA: 3'-5' exonuclease [Spirochaetota bacterium]|nr:3'-5' exonuclease [Spirochaetota bacterium]HOM37943.1 3'-5' exonuclease [Spirochaetota bacterium]HPQ48747.1 3'-5' exonuclease [Spirochaetota bacterium]
MDIFLSLNETQAEAVKVIDRPLLILAGAGSGKTRVITYKIAYILKFFDPSSVLALTFTNKAADEMKERVFSLVGRKKDLVVSTFHSFGYRFLKEEIKNIGYNEKFVIYSEEDKEVLIRNIIVQMGLDPGVYNPKNIGKLISFIKNRFINSREIEKNIQDINLLKIYSRYTDELKKFNSLDLDDLIYLPVLILSSRNDIKEKWNDRIDYILVDEYQDTNYLQYLLLKLLAGHKNRICVVGDDDQSIYAFRGANIDNILMFENDFPGAKKIVLNINYRNNPTILKASYSLIKNNLKRHTKNIISHNKNDNKIQFFEAINRIDEAKWIAKNIFKNRLEGIPYSNQAVLCRTNYLIKYIEPILREENIPYKIIGATSFFDKKEIKDIVAYLRLINNTKDNIAFLRAINVSKKNIGDKTLEVIKENAGNGILYQVALKIDSIEEIKPNARALIKEFTNIIEYYKQEYSKNKNMKETTERLIEDIGYYNYLKMIYKDKELEKRLNNISFFLDYMGKIKIDDNDDILSKFLITFMLSNNEDNRENENKVSLMTIHASKGLEFDAVFIAGFEEGIIPHQNSIDENNIEEERRLVYVAFTRAKNRLYISYSASGKDKNTEVSRFFSEIGDEFFEGIYKEGEETDFYLQRLREIIS